MITLLTFKSAVGFLGFPCNNSDVLRWQAIVDLIFVLECYVCSGLERFFSPTDFKMVEIARMYL